MAYRRLVAPLGLEVDAVLGLLEDGLVGGIQETVVQLEPVVPDHLVLLVVRVRVDGGGKRVVVVTAGGPVPQGCLAEVDLVQEGVGPVGGLGSHLGLVGRRGEGGGGFSRGLLRILGGERSAAGQEGQGEDDNLLHIADLLINKTLQR